MHAGHRARIVKIAGASDLHGKLGISFPKCDIIALVGDLVPLYSTAENWKHWQEYDWLKRKFIRFLRRIIKQSGCKYVIIVPGNHDICFYCPETRKKVYEKLLAIPEVIILDDMVTAVNCLGINIAGFPYTPTIQSRKWAYNMPRSRADGWKAMCEYAIPEGTRLLLTHGPPLGILDGSASGQDHFGSADLMKRVLDVGPDVIMCGHAHEARGKRQRYYVIGGKRGTAVNVSICDTGYSEKGSKIQMVEMEV